ncbi:MAG: aminotransferase class V-fold PLP-dependent enzyme, partial [Anaerolineales bacterium]
MAISQKQASYRDLYLGLDLELPIINGGSRKYINFDNAASTPALKHVQDVVDHFLLYYSSVHRGTGYKSQLSTHAYERSRELVLEFLGAHLDEHVCIFGKNTTEAINKLSHRFPFTAQRNVVITTGMEHHSDDLPWRAVAHTVHVGLLPDGRLDEAAFDAKLEIYRKKVALVAVTGASNVTGYLNPIHRLAEKAHAVGAQILVDCAQLAPHRKVNMRSLDDPGHLDYVSISGHKMYAPFGTGALVGRRDCFESGDPDMVGGGTVEIVTLDDVVWAGPPDRDEAGSPNTVGAVALGAAITKLEQVGMAAVAQHEAELTAYALEQLAEVPGIRIFGDRDPSRAAERLGVIPFLIEDISHFLVSAVLGHEYSIGVRSGCFCAHPYILKLLGLSDAEAVVVREEMLDGNKAEMPGLIRASFGLYNERDEIDAFIQALKEISQGRYQGTYVQERA